MHSQSSFIVFFVAHRADSDGEVIEFNISDPDSNGFVKVFFTNAIRATSENDDRNGTAQMDEDVADPPSNEAEQQPDPVSRFQLAEWNWSKFVFATIKKLPR